MLRSSGGQRFLGLALGWFIVVFVAAGTAWPQGFTFAGVVYSGVPPDKSRPLSGVTVSLYGDEDEWPENGPKTLLAQTVSDSGGAFSLTWEAFRRPYAYYHIQEADTEGTVSTGAEAPPPGGVKNLNTISYLDLPPGTYAGIAFWDLQASGPPALTPGGPLPDLMVGDLGFDPEFPVEGGPLFVRVVVRNVGTGRAPDFEVALRVGEGREPVRFTIGGLAAGGEISVGSEVPGLPPGTHRLVAEVDSEGRIAEQREDNNVLSREVEVAAGPGHGTLPLLPDLTVVAVNVTPRTVAPEEEATLTVVVANVGSARAERTRVEIRTEAGDLVAGVPLPALAPGQETEVDCAVRFQHEVEVTLVVIVDPANEVPELSEENNEGRAALWVVEKELPDLAILNVSLTAPLSPILPWLVSVRVENRGLAPAGPFLVSLKQGQASVSSPRLADGLEAGASLNVVLFATSFSTARPLIAAVDGLGWVEESDEGNNVFSLLPSAPTLPDLSVASVTLSDSAPRVGSKVTISVAVTNGGGAAVERPEVLITIVDPAVVVAGDENGPWFQFAVLTALPNLEAGATMTYSAEWTPETSGSLLIRVEADPFGTLWEVDEADNAADLRVTVQGG